MENYLTPSKIVEELDKYIIGQKDAKKAVAIALRNRWRRLQVPTLMRNEIMPNNILMIGSTGVGKTEIARRLAQLADAPFIKVEASKFTEVGYVGRDVESMVRDLLENSINMVKERVKVQNREKATEVVREKILDILIPPIPKPKLPDDTPANAESDAELNERTREKFRIKLEDGELDHRTIEIEITIPGHNVHVMGPVGIEGIDGIQDILSNMVPKKKKQKTMTVAEAKEYFMEEETQKLIDMDQVAREAIEKAENSGIIFIDEIDKIVSNTATKGSADVSREGVQRDLLPIVEGSVINTKYGSIKTDHVLFIAAGAFHVAKPSEMIPELQGRFPIRVELNPLTREDFIKILTQPKNALTRQYQALLSTESIELEFDETAIEEIASIAFEVNQQVENIGARRLHTILSNLLDDILFEVPDRNTEHAFSINREFVAGKLKNLVKSKDLSHYIL